MNYWELVIFSGRVKSVELWLIKKLIKNIVTTDRHYLGHFKQLQQKEAIDM